MENMKLEPIDTSVYKETYEMTDSDWKMVKKAFDVFSDYDDRLATNIMSAECLPIALRAMKLIPSEEEIQQYIEKYFKNAGIDEETFNSIAQDCWIDELGIENAVWNAFFVFDEHQSGLLSPDVMRSILLTYGEPLPEDEAQQILKKCVNKDNLAFYSPLINQWKKINIFPNPKDTGKKRKNGKNQK